MSVLALSGHQFAFFIDKTGAMILTQKMPDSAAAIKTVPRLAISDIERTTRPNTIKLRIEGGDVLVATTAVNPSFGILHLDFGLDFGNVDFNDVPLLPVTARLFLECKTKL